MVAVAEIGWSRYQSFEGPFFRGDADFLLPDNPTQEDLILGTLTSTEGGHWNSYNGYDVCIATAGLIQLCEKFYLTSDLLGYIAKRRPDLMDPITLKAASRGVTFKPNARGRYRFFFGDARGEVDRPQEQRQLFHLDSTGHKGTWDIASRQHAKEWASAISTVLGLEEAIPLQRSFTVPLLRGFARKDARRVIDSAPDTPLGQAFESAYISFAANNPTWAARNLSVAMASTGAEIYSHDWLVVVLKQLTFGPKVTIYPHRYNAIRPFIERNYGIDLPDFATELRQWTEELGGGELLTVTAAQEILIDSGYDLGRSGADGNAGAKTKAAITAFQHAHGIESEFPGYIDPPTRTALVMRRDALRDVAESIPPELLSKVSVLVTASMQRLAREAVADISAARGALVE